MNDESKYVERILFSQEDIKKRVHELGQQIIEDYCSEEADLLLVGILKGAVIFMADLMKEIPLDVEIDFMSVSSYGASTVSSGDVRIIKDLENPVMGKNILIVEDIIDSGYTVDYLKRNLYHRGARSVKVATLLNKQERRANDLKADYIGFEVPNTFVVGYGMDFNQKFRNLPYVGVLKERYYKD